MSPRRAASFLCLLLSMPLPLSAQETKDLGFEKGALGSIPSPWFVPTKGWKAGLDESKASSGRRSVKLELVETTDVEFGNVMQHLPAAGIAGRHVVLKAKILVEGRGRAQMWLRADLKNNAVGAFDNMDDRPILPGGWKDASIEADIEEEAQYLSIGVMAFDGATVFIDEVKIETAADKTPVQEPSAPLVLSARGKENLVAASKMLSYVRFFHPSDQAAGVASWDHFAVELMAEAEPATDAKDLAKRLQKTFQEIAPTVEIWAGTIQQTPAARPATEGAEKLDEFAMWKHSGVGLASTTIPQQLYSSVVERVDRDDLPGGPEKCVVTKSLGGGVSCRIPLAIPRDEQGTLPHGKTPARWASKKGGSKLSGLNRASRFAGVALAWGCFEHFYPYFDVVQTDWEAALPAALSKAAVDADEIAYLFTLREMVAKLHDGHGSVFNKQLMAKSFLPVAVEWAGEDLVIVGKDESASKDAEIGDVVVSIDGKKIEDCYVEVSRHISAATDWWSRYVSQRSLVVSLPTKDPATVIVRKANGGTKSLSLTRIKEMVASAATEKRPENGTELASGLVYFNLNGAQTEALNEAMPKLAAAKAILFDLRGYPGSAGYQLMQHLISEPATSARWCVPVTRFPDREGVEWNESGRWELQPAEPHLGAKIGFITDGRAISYAESVMGIVENYKFGEIIGSTTAGTNGNVNPFMLPGGYVVSWTGMKVLKHDGTRHHGVGIAPTVPVVPTPKGIREGRDEVLDKAVEVMKAKITVQGGGGD